MPDDAPAVTFTRFVSSVEGRLVTRWDAQGSSFGARVATAEERAAGDAPISWDPTCVVPLTPQFCAKFDRELRNAIRNGDLKERTEADWQAWRKHEEEREAARLEVVKATEEAAAKAAEEAAEKAAAQPPTDSSAPAESKPEGKKRNK